MQEEGSEGSVSVRERGRGQGVFCESVEGDGENEEAVEGV